MADVLVLGAGRNNNRLILNESSDKKDNEDEKDGNSSDSLNNFMLKYGQKGVDKVYEQIVKGSIKDGKLGELASKFTATAKAGGRVSKGLKTVGLGPMELIFSGINIATAEDKNKATAVEIADYAGGFTFGGLGAGVGFFFGGPLGAAIVGGLASVVGGIIGSEFMKRNYEKMKKRMEDYGKKHPTVVSNLYAFEKKDYSAEQYVNNAIPVGEKRPPLKYIGKIMRKRGKKNKNTIPNSYAYGNKKYSAEQYVNNASGAVKRPPLLYAGDVMRKRGIKNKEVTSNSYAFDNKKYTYNQYSQSSRADTKKRSANSVLRTAIQHTVKNLKPQKKYSKINKFFNKLGRFFGKKFADGGLVNGTTYGMVGEDGPEMIIPLSGQRRQRGLDLWNKAGDMLGVPKYAEGAIKGTKGKSALPKPKSSPLKAPGDRRKGAQGRSTGAGKISVGNIAIELEGVAGADILKTLQEQKGQIAHEVKNILSEAVRNASRTVSAVN